MLYGLTYRKKNRMLLAAGILLLLLTYMFSVRKTIDLYNETGALQTQYELSSEAPVKIAHIEKQLQEIEQFVSPGVSSQKEEQSLLDIVTAYCQPGKVVLREFPKAVYTEEKDFIVETNVLTLEGGFTDLLRLVHLLEKEQKTGKISSARFYLKKDIRTKTTALNAAIYLQTIKNTAHE